MNIEKLTANIVLSKSEREILVYILENLNEATKIGIRGIAAKNFTSTSTVMRLAKKLNYSGFVEMLYDFKSQTSTPLVKDSIQQQVPSSRLELYRQLWELLDQKTVLVYGMGFSEIVAEYIYKKLLVMGKKCWFIQTLEFETVLKNFNGNIGAIFIVSKSGKTKYMLEIAVKAKASRISIVVFTGNINSNLAALADLVVGVYDDHPSDDENALPNDFFGRAIMEFEQILRSKDIE